MYDWGIWARLARRRLGLRQQDIADAVRCSRHTICNYECGRTGAPHSWLQGRIVQLLQRRARRADPPIDLGTPPDPIG